MSIETVAKEIMNRELIPLFGYSQPCLSRPIFFETYQKCL